MSEVRSSSAATSSQGNLHRLELRKKQIVRYGPVPFFRRQRTVRWHRQRSDPVDQRLAAIHRFPTDWIGDHALVARADRNHRPAGQERLRFHRTAERHPLAVPWTALARVKLLTYRGVESIRSDQHIGPHDGPGLSCRSIDEMRRDRPFVLLEAGEVPASHHRPGTQPLPYRLQKANLQGASVDRVLRPPVPGRQAARLGPDSLPQLGVVRKLGGRNGGPGQNRGQAELGELAHRVRLKV